MAISAALITYDQMQRILLFQENHFFDFKAIEIQPGKLTRTRYVSRAVRQLGENV